jgi:hypothetical protein
MAGKLPAQFWPRLTTEFESSFDIDELKELYRVTFDARLEIKLRFDTVEHAVSDLFELMDRTGMWIELLRAAQAERPQAATFLAVCGEVLDHFAQEMPAVGGTEGKPLRATLLLRDLPFVDRDSVREAVADMDRPSGWSGLVVRGPRQVGKTYLCEFLGHMKVQSWSGDRIAPVILERERSYAMPLEELARRLALAVRPGQADTNPPPKLLDQKDERWAADLAVWLAGLIDLSGCRVWVVLDGFDHPDVPPPVHELIAGLAEQAAWRANFRLVLLGYAPPQPWPDHIERNIRPENLAYVTAAQLREFFAGLDRRLGYRRAAACTTAAAAADRLVELYDALPPGDARQVKALKQALPGVVRDLVKNAAATRPPA